MLRFMKYEIRGTYRYITGVLILSLILFTAIYHYVNRGSTGSLGGNLFVTLCILLLFGTALVTFLYIVGSFRKELYEDTGYLTFTLPLTGYQITASKLLVALLWFFVLGVAVTAINLVLIFAYLPLEISFGELLRQIAIAEMLSFKHIFVFLLDAVLSGVGLLALIYFSMALSRVTFRNRKIGGLWFAVFLILAVILGYGGYRIADLLPYSLDLGNLNDGAMTTGYATNNFIFMIKASTVKINIAGFVFSLLTAAALFLGTGYLVEMKTDL